MNEKMKIEIWSDIVCPWCFIGKRKFEQALAQFPGKDQVEIEWKSYQLAPETVTDTSLNINEYLAKHKGIDVKRAKEMNEHVTRIAAGVGLQYRFDRAIPANTFNAHCMIHFAKTRGKQTAAKERLLAAYFFEGKNIDDIATLRTLGEEIGLDGNALQQALENGTFANAVRSDIMEGQQLGLKGVPFFVFDRKYGVSGAQETEIFLKTLEKSYDDWKKDHPEAVLKMEEGKSCTPDKDCD